MPASHPKKFRDDVVAVTRRGEAQPPSVGPVFGDVGQPQSRKLVAALNALDLVGSMGRVGAAGDNAAKESFFALLQKNVLNTRLWTTR